MLLYYFFNQKSITETRGANRNIEYRTNPIERVPLISGIQGCAEQLCGFEPWELSPMTSLEHSIKGMDIK
jgi:hypothetical protein